MKSFEEKFSPGEKLLYGDGYFSGDYNQALVLRRSKEGTKKREEFYLSILLGIIS